MTLLVWCLSAVNAEEKASFYVNLGVSYYELGNYDQAVKRFQKAIELDPDYPGLYGLLGSALLQGGEIDQAIEAYRNQIAKTPDIGDVHFNLGGLHESHLDDIDRAIQEFEKFISLSKNEEKIKEVKGHLQELRGEGPPE